MKFGWLHEEHECRKPSAGRRGIGSIWRCRCGQAWRIIAKRQAGINEIVTWRELGEGPLS